jgi:hypothetical protein
MAARSTGLAAVCFEMHHAIRKLHRDNIPFAPEGRW